MSANGGASASAGAAAASAAGVDGDGDAGSSNRGMVSGDSKDDAVASRLNPNILAFLWMVWDRLNLSNVQTGEMRDQDLGKFKNSLEGKCNSNAQMLLLALKKAYGKFHVQNIRDVSSLDIYRALDAEVNRWIREEAEGYCGRGLKLQAEWNKKRSVSQPQPSNFFPGESTHEHRPQEEVIPSRSTEEAISREESFRRSLTYRMASEFVDSMTTEWPLIETPEKQEHVLLGLPPDTRRYLLQNSSQKRGELAKELEALRAKQQALRAKRDELSRDRSQEKRATCLSDERQDHLNKLRKEEEELKKKENELTGLTEYIDYLYYTLGKSLVEGDRGKIYNRPLFLNKETNGLIRPPKEQEIDETQRKRIRVCGFLRKLIDDGMTHALGAPTPDKPQIHDADLSARH